MQMDARLILAGQPVNALAALDAGTQAAGRAGMVGQQGDLLSLYRQQGPGIAAGDPTALNALASLDPMASLGVQESRLGMDATRQSMRINEEQLGLARAAGARAAEAHAASMSAAERQRQAAETRAALTTVLPALRQAEQTGDLTTINQMLRTYGMEPVGSVEEAYVRYMQVEGAVETLETFRGLTAGPEPDYMTLNDQLVDRNAPGGPAVVPVQGLQQGGGGTAADQAIARMESIGIPRDVAIRIEDGVFTTSRDPVTGEVIVLDVASQSIVMRVDQDGNVVSGQGAAPSQPDLGFSPETTRSTNAENAFGLRGIIGGAGNFVTDFLGLPPVAPEVAENQRFFRVLEEDLLVDLSQAYGRQPAAALMERLRRLAPNVGTMEGANSAVGELRALRDRFVTDLASAERGLNRRMSAEDRAAAQQRVSGLQAAISRIDNGLSRFGGAGGQGAGGNRTQSGVTWSIVE